MQYKGKAIEIVEEKDFFGYSLQQLHSVASAAIPHAFS
jgi:hypothetical protein